MFRTMRGAALLLAAALTLTACGGDTDPLSDSGGSAETLVIGSADFPESLALAEVYRQALAAKGIKAETKKAGTREAYYKSLERGEIHIFPEYNGNLLLHLDTEATAVTTDEVDAALKQELPATLEILDSAPAEDKDAVTVTKKTADEHGLKTIADLKPVAGDMVVGGPSEFKTRQAGLVGIKRKYGFEFKEFKPLDTGGPITVAALRKGDVQAANLFTTDAAISRNGFVVLEDPENVFPAQNVTPLVNKAKVTGAARSVLNAISAKLTTADLLSMNTEMSVDKADPDDVAEKWLTGAGLL